MNTINISTKEIELIQEINQDANLLELALQYVRRKKRELNKISCQFSMDELANELEMSERDIEEGNVFSQAELKQLHPEWK